MFVITYYPHLKVGNNVKNFINKAKKLYQKRFAAKGKNKAPIKNKFNLLIIELIINSTIGIIR